MTTTTKRTDIAVQNEGTIYILAGHTERGAEWLADRLDPDAQRWGSGYVVEWRFVQAILDGAIADGLNLKAV